MSFVWHVLFWIVPLLFLVCDYSLGNCEAFVWHPSLGSFRSGNVALEWIVRMGTVSLGTRCEINAWEFSFGLFRWERRLGSDAWGNRLVRVGGPGLWSCVNFGGYPSPDRWDTQCDASWSEKNRFAIGFPETLGTNPEELLLIVRQEWPNCCVELFCFVLDQ